MFPPATRYRIPQGETRQEKYQRYMYMQVSEHRSVALDINRRTARLRTLQLCDLTPAFPGRALQHLRERQLLRGQTEGLPYQVCNAVAIEPSGM